MTDTRRTPGRVPEMAREWLEVAPDMKEFLNTLQQIITDAQDEAGDVGAAIAFFMGSSFAGASGGWLGGSVTDGDKGDITTSSGGTVWTIDNNVVTDAKLRDSAALTVIGRSANSLGDSADIAATADGQVLQRRASVLTWAVPDLAVSPAQLTANQNDYDPGAGTIVRVSSDASRDITGVVAGVSGQRRQWVNVGAQNVVLKHANGGSAAANQFLNATAADITLAPNEAADTWYDATSTVWRAYKK